MVVQLSKATKTPPSDLVKAYGSHLFGVLASKYGAMVEGMATSFDLLKQIEDVIHVNAEALLEAKSLELYRANESLRDLNKNLERRVQERIEELARANQDLELQIKERNKAEQRLRITQFSVDRASDSVYWLDSAGTIVYANQAASETLGYSQDELLGMRVFDIDKVMDEKAWPSHWEELRRRHSFSIESTHVTKDGRPFPVEVLVNHIVTGDVEYNCAYVRDITERVDRRKTVERYGELQEIIRKITRSFLESSDLSKSIDLTLQKLGHYLGADRSFLIRFRDNEQMVFNTHEWLKDGVESREQSYQDVPISELGWWVQKLSLGQPIELGDIHESDVPERVGASLRRDHIRAMLALPVIVDGTLTGMIGFELQDQPRRWAEDHTALMMTVTEVLGRAVERRIAERDREQHKEELSSALQDATKANQAKTVFLANMSHEIRTPLTAIAGYSEMLKSDTGLNDEQEGWIDQVVSSAGHLSDLINDVLDLSKIEAEELPISFEPVDLSKLVKGAVDLVQPIAVSKGLKLRAVIDPTSPELVETDSKRLKQITINLIQNAVKFTDRGEVTVHVRPTETLVAGQSGYEVRVEDSGIGMSPERLEQVFRPLGDSFYSIAGERGGAGLGLTISRHLAELLQGEITGDSKPNHGSVITLKLPTGDPNTDSLAAKPLADQQPELPPLSGVNCLAIDDNPDNQRIIQYLLSQEGASVTIAGSGREGIELATDPYQSSGFDVILLDIQMPGMDGYTVARMLRQEGIEIPIIALTAHAMADDREKCLQAGFDDYVAKPINLDQLTASIRRGIKANRQPLAEQQAKPTQKSIRSSRADDERFRPLLDAYLKSLAEAHGNIDRAFNNGDWEQNC
eukprot:g12150.t1